MELVIFETMRDNDSKAVAQHARLHYVSDRRPGLQRKHCGHGFRYVTAEGKRANRAEFKRIRELTIPPATLTEWFTGPSSRPARNGLSSEEAAVLRLLKRPHAVG